MNNLKTKVEQVKAKLGISTMELSERLGKNPYYLYKVLNGVSTERQKELMLELEFVANGGQMHTGSGIAEMLENEREVSQSLRIDLSEAQTANKELCKKIDLSMIQFRQLEKMYDSNWDELQALKEENGGIKAVNRVAIEERYELQQKVASLQEYKKKYHNLVAALFVIGVIVILSLAIWSVV